MIDTLLIKDWIDSMGRYVLQLEKASEKKDANEINRLRIMISELHKNIANALEEKNV